MYQGNQITIYYDENTWDFTKLARIENVSREELLESFGDLAHAACPMPSAILKCIEAETSLALPADVSFVFEA